MRMNLMLMTLALAGLTLNADPIACARGARRLTDLAALPVYDAGASIQSDGSESWGSWGWGFAAPPQVHPFSAYHSPNGLVLWSELRLTFADSCPFRRFLRFDLEHGTSNNHPESSSSGQCFGYLLP